MAVPLEVLQSLASGFSAVRAGPELVAPGTPVAVQLVSAATDLRATDMLPGALELTWITKNVRFKNHTVEPIFDADPFDPLNVDGVLLGGMPARVPVVGNLVGTEALEGIPGQLAQLAGELPIPVEVPVGVAVTWSVLAEDGVTVLAEGPGTFTAPQGTTAHQVSFVFAPQTVELTATAPVATVRRFIRASITLTAGGTNHPFTLPDIPILVPAIPIPSVVVFFLHTDFAATSGDDEGAAFVVVPNNSPLKNVAQLQATLNTLQSTLSSLTSIAEFAAFLLGINELASALSAQPHVQLRVAHSANHFNNFNSVTLIQRAWHQNDTEAEDELSSMIFLGPQRKSVQCFNARSRKTGEGAFTLTVGPKLHALVRNLHAASPVSGPDGNEIAVAPQPPGGIFGTSTFGDELSSLRFP